MKIPTHIIEQIKDKIIISDYIGKVVKLERKGTSYLGLCPFHNEKTPSFNVLNNKNFYHCFGCGVSGDVIQFTKDYYNLDFNEAIKRLAPIAGISLPKENFSKEEINQQLLANRLYAILDKANNWFCYNLKINTGKEALYYLTQRKITTEQIKKFSLGFAPNNEQSLYNFLLKEGFKTEEIEKAGLIIKSKINYGYFDRFRNRIIFPIYNHKNKIVGFGARTTTNEMPKYLNSPETDLFKKNEILFASNLISTKAKNILVVEGYMDVISLHKAGINYAVATLGTAFTQNHLVTLWKYSNEPIICLDGDKSGKEAMFRIAKLALPLIKEGYSIKFVILPQSKDPDNVINEFGKEYFENLLKNAVPLSEFIWQEEFRKATTATPEQRAAFELKIEKLINDIANTSVKNNYKAFFNNKIWHNIKKFANYQKNKYNANFVKVTNLMVQNNDIIDRYQRSLLAMVICYPNLLNANKIYEQFIEIEFIDKNLEEIRTFMLENLSKIFDNEIFINDELTKKGYKEQLENLYGVNSTYFDKFSSPDIDIQNIRWQLTYKKMFLELLKKEYETLVKNMTIESENKAIEIRLEILKIENQIKAKEFELEQ